MKYLRATYHVEDAGHREILIAVLSDVGFAAFEESGADLHAFIPQDQYNRDLTEQMVRQCGVPLPDPVFSVIEERNWNAEWEAHFQPVLIADSICVRASFHAPMQGIEYDLVIDPKMSFGTGHHETTHLMLEFQLGIEHHGKKVLDVGTGTGILSVFAFKRGARWIESTDTDTWSIQNCRENFELNGVQNYRIDQGTIQNLTLDRDYDIILANINKNVILEQLEVYATHLSAEGVLLTSGFYARDRAEITGIAEKVHLHLVDQKARNGWTALLFTRKK